ncbi:unnamed protein product [Bemisia tabaci]|uniref:Uncharacterized protein n=1 Tax=Bemisia tabaci TaxID=7038 RepID=A0A9P0ADW6_BEMTA|nr:unnamed protein product [Bemisia tabaci]
MTVKLGKDVDTRVSKFLYSALVYKRRQQYSPYSDKKKLCPNLCSGYMELKDLTFD